MDFEEIERPFWQKRFQEAWRKRPIVWLSGVRRTGKTTLARSLSGTTFLNCDLPSTGRLLGDPERFFESVRTPIVVFDEIHQLDNPSMILKIGADSFKHLKILATGSSTLGASKKFRDTLTDRKRSIHLLPVLPEEARSFARSDLMRRLQRGGLPPALLSDSYDPEFYAEWLDSFFARDIQELFAVEKRQPFLKLLELLLLENGHLLDASGLARLSGLSRPTIVRYLEILESTQAISVIRPFSGNSKQALVHQPKVYGFDTGFVSFARGWKELRSEDCGNLLENLTLESLQAIAGSHPIHYWRTKQKREIDFVVPVARNLIHAVECKWKSTAFSPDHLKAFREDHPQGKNILVCSDVRHSHEKSYGKLTVRLMGIEGFREEFEALLQSR